MLNFFFFFILLFSLFSSCLKTSFTSIELKKRAYRRNTRITTTTTATLQIEVKEDTVCHWAMHRASKQANHDSHRDNDKNNVYEQQLSSQSMIVSETFDGCWLIHCCYVVIAYRYYRMTVKKKYLRMKRKNTTKNKSRLYKVN